LKDNGAPRQEPVRPAPPSNTKRRGFMPQLKKRGKYIFGWSIVNDEYRILLPPEAIAEYGILEEKKVIIISGSKRTGGFCVSRKGLLEKSALKDLLVVHSELINDGIQEGTFIKYKGRLYCWLSISENGELTLTRNIIEMLEISKKQKLLSIRGSDIAFVMGAKGPLIQRAQEYIGQISVF
jgi:hypothetical protein